MRAATAAVSCGVKPYIGVVAALQCQLRSRVLKALSSRVAQGLQLLPAMWRQSYFAVITELDVSLSLGESMPMM